MIGIALGSPGLLKQNEALPPPRFDTSIFSGNGQGLTHKPSKWKKIGGLFKAKQALTSSPEEMHTAEAKLPHEYRQFEKPRKTKERKNSTEEWPAVEVDPPQNRTHESPKRGRKFSLSGNKAPKSQPQPPPNPGPMLSVNIPDVQMERYSVMFRDVVDKNQRPPLLARRAKTLDNLQVPDVNVCGCILYLKCFTDQNIGLYQGPCATPNASTPGNIASTINIHPVPDISTF